MNDERPFQHRPADFKTAMDGSGGLVRLPLEGGIHGGRELFMDEPDIPTEIFATPRREPFEWWTAALTDAMAKTSLGSDPAAPPVRYVLEIDDETREPRYVATQAPEPADAAG
jgi:hypothetical protein